MNDIKMFFYAIGDYLGGASWFLMARWPFWILLFAVAAGGVYTARFGKKTLFCRSISGAIKLCGIYQVAIILYTVVPVLRSLPFGLPFLFVSEESVGIADPLNLNLGTLSPILLELMFLTLLVDFVESLNPGGKTILTWVFSQFLTVFISLSAYLIIVAVINFLMPSSFGSIAIIPVMIVFTVFLLVLCAKFIFTVVLDRKNPQFRSIYDFFTKNKTGSLMTVSALSFLFSGAAYAVLSLTGSNGQAFASTDLIGLCFILFLLLLAEYVFTMYYCGKKK